MKKLLTLFIMFLYLHIVMMMIIESQFIFIMISFVIIFILSCLNIICAIIESKKLRTDVNKQKFVNQTIFIVKLVSIPFFIINYSLWSTVAGMLLLTPGGIFLDFILVPIGVFFTYFTLLATSFYSISLLFALYKKGNITRKQFIVHTIFQLLFLTDIIDQFIIKKFTRIKS